MEPPSRDGQATVDRQGLAVLGSTGSIGTQTLEVVRLFAERFDVRALTCGQNVELLAKQIREFRPNVVGVGAPQQADRLKRALSGFADSPRILVGEGGLCEVATLDEVDVVVGAVVGVAGLRPVLDALEAGKRVALANKETLVVGRPLVKRALEDGDGELIPVDSEHSAIFQCLVGESPQRVEEIVLTASGGPFRDRPLETFDQITVNEALDHPNWSMGAKITIDSATMMNKGLEVIEAQCLFDLDLERIRVLVHPQSIVHSMVAFSDGAVKAQLGVPDMKVPIQFALSYPERWAADHERLDWAKLTRLDFHEPDLEKFPCLRLAYDAAGCGGSAPAVLNAANEVAVRLFLDEEIGFRDIPQLIERALENVAVTDCPDLEDLYDVDERARQYVQELALRASD